MFGDILDVTAVGVLLASKVEARDAPEPLKCTGWPPTTQNCLAQIVGWHRVQTSWWFLNKNYLYEIIVLPANYTDVLHPRRYFECFNRFLILSVCIISFSTAEEETEAQISDRAGI